MKIHYLGTGAAEGFPGLFCSCDACNRARKFGGRNIKTRSCALINNKILIDLSPDIYMQSLRDHVSLYSVTDLIVTHTHCDHLDLFSLALRARDGASQLLGTAKDNYISVYGSQFVKDAIDSIWDKQPYANKDRIYYHYVEAGKAFCIDNIWFYPFEANHKPDETCFIYAINEEDVWLLYANDTGTLSNKTISQIKNLNIQFDFVSMDCARGNLPGDSHMGIVENRKLRGLLEDANCVHDKTQFYLNHLSHMSGLTHDELQVIAEKEGFFVAYDGLIKELKKEEKH